MTSLPAKTAAGHATLYTGAWPDRHGVAGNEVVRAGASLLEPVSGYRSEALLAEPLWVTAARQGLDATMLCATQDYPYAPYEGGKRFGGDFGREPDLRHRLQGTDAGRRGLPLGGPPAARIAFGLARAVARGRAGDRAGRRGLGASSACSTTIPTIRCGASTPCSSPSIRMCRERFASSPAPREIPRASARSRSASRAWRCPSSSASLPSPRTGGPAPLPGPRRRLPVEPGPRARGRGLKATGGLRGERRGTISTTQGALGRTLPEGGDGTAERRYLETVRLVERQFERLLDFGAARTRWDVLVGYLPFPDEFLHLWWGHLDPSLPGHDPVLAEPPSALPRRGSSRRRRVRGRPRGNRPTPRPSSPWAPITA